MQALSFVNPKTDKPAAWTGPEEGGVIAIRQSFRLLGADRRGATAIEYGLIVGLIVIAMMTGLRALGGGTKGMWGKVLNVVANNM
jgi:pilus assembly protein Flp/PilA